MRSDNAAEMVKLRARRHRTTSRAAGDGWGEEGDSSEQGRREPGEKMRRAREERAEEKGKRKIEKKGEKEKRKKGKKRKKKRRGGKKKEDGSWRWLNKI